MTTPSPHQDPNNQLWMGILSRSEHGIVQALGNGADATAGPSEYVQGSYKERRLPGDLLPVCGLFRESERLRSSSYDHRHMQFKSACKALIKATRKKHFGLRAGTTPLIEYARVGKGAQRHAIFMQVLRRTPKDVLNAHDEYGFSALDYAIESGLLQSVKALIAAGCDPDACNSRGENALWREGKQNQDTLRRKEHLDIVMVLLRHGSKVRANHEGNSYLHMDTTMPLSQVDLGEFDLNTSDAKGNSLGMKALAHNAWPRLRELMDHPTVDLARQFPDPELVVNKRQQLSTYDTMGRELLAELESRCQQTRLDQVVPAAHTSTPRPRF